MRRTLLITCLIVFPLVFLPLRAATAQADRVSCASYDAWEWAQLVFETDPQQAGALDPDGDGIACPELPRGGFAPAIWTDTIPADVEEAQVVLLIDGDTLEVLLNGVTNRVRIYRADTPETQNETHCGGTEATNFAAFALSLNDTPGIVYLERDVTTRDQYGRELAYVWFEIDGKPYMLNHLLIATGWAEDVDYGDRKYDAELQQAAAVAQEHQLGVYGICGAFGMPLGDTQSEPVAEAAAEQAPAAPAVQEPVAPVVEQPAAGGGCDPNYTPCVPIVSYDLDCGDIGFSVTVIGSDPHGFDGNDNDGLGCESF